MAWKQRRKRVSTMVVTSPTDKVSRVRLPLAVAFAAARGIARETHYDVVIDGRYGKAKFHRDGRGVVDWNERSTLPMKTTEFDERTTVMVD